MKKIDVARLLGAVTRESLTREREGQPVAVVLASRGYDTPIEDLWDAVTSPERIARWLLPVSGDLKLGGRYQLEGNAGGTITRCNPPRELAVTWEYAGTISWVEARLEEDVHGGSILRLEHIAPLYEELERQYGPGAGGVGWELWLAGLDLHLSRGADALTPTQLKAWLETDDGKALIRGASEGWADAAIAAGTPERAAREAAQRTAAFYGG
ncbi:MAG: SRPBCC family protein [Deltaproteobacteria bacterium]|nr:SRPBCC family protein [Nannocystaceae bacterium]